MNATKIKIPKHMSGQLEMALMNAPKYTGSFDFREDGLSMFEEVLTMEEVEIAYAFGDWLVANERTFGWNLPTVWAEFVGENAAAGAGV